MSTQSPFIPPLWLRLNLFSLIHGSSHSYFIARVKSITQLDGHANRGDKENSEKKSVPAHHMTESTATHR